MTMPFPTGPAQPADPDPLADGSLYVADGRGGIRTIPSSTYVPQQATIAITYNADGTVATLTENGVLSTFTYNANGTVNTVTRSGVTRTYSYNADGTVSGVA